MPFESPSQKTQNPSEALAQGFRELVQNKENAHVFIDLERTLERNRINLATEGELSRVFSDNTLLCRSESFSKVIDLLTVGNPIEILNTGGSANMCVMASGNGFRTAMVEGFSGKDVDGAVKVVVTFKGKHITSQNKIPPTHELWNHKPKTAQLSLSGKGTITMDDIAMVSFRIPTQLFPEYLLSETERENTEELGIKFIVRHYIPEKEKAMH